MSNRFDNAQALVTESRRALLGIEQAYRNNLTVAEVPASTHVAIKNLLENLRSALDFCAVELHGRFGRKLGRRRIYFPIDHERRNRDAFGVLVEKCVPGLGATRPDLVDLLFKFQAASGNNWLPELATMTNLNKHDDLTPQQRIERERIAVQSAGAYIAYSPSAQVRIGPSVRIFGSPVHPVTQVPLPSPGVCVTKTTFVRYDLLPIGRPVLHFLRQCADGVEKMVLQIQVATEGRRTEKEA